jgi:predicted dienelactone hydrolase
VKLIFKAIGVVVVLCGNLAAQTNSFQMQRAVWHDAKRDRDVPVKIYSPATTNMAHPVIIYSHGLGGSREGYQYLGQYWAARGYVVVHLQHAGSDDGVWRDTPVWKRKNAMQKSAANVDNAINRPLDVTFAIDELERMNRESDSWRGRLDLDRIGVAGHSFGAFTTLASAGMVLQPGRRVEKSFSDPRIKAAIPMSSPATRSDPEKSFGAIKIPCLHMTGTLDSSPIGETSPAQRRIAYDHSNGSDQYLITFKEGDHMIFSGRGGARNNQDEIFQRLIQQSSTAFWDAYLRGDARAKSWLTNDFKIALGAEGAFEMKFKP